MLTDSTVRLVVNISLIRMFGKKKYCAFAHPELDTRDGRADLESLNVITLKTDNFVHAYKMISKISKFLISLKAQRFIDGCVVDIAGHNDKLIASVYTLSPNNKNDKEVLQTIYIRVSSLEGMYKSDIGAYLIGGD